MASVATENLSSDATVELFKQHVIPNYGRYPVNLVRGEGSRIWDSEGTEYLDLFPGWGCNLLGHCPDKIVAAVQDQVAKLIHVPNTWHMEAQGKWAQLLAERALHRGIVPWHGDSAGGSGSRWADQLARGSRP